MPWFELQLSGLPRTRLVDVSRRLFALGASGTQEEAMPGEGAPPQQPWDVGPPPPPPRTVVLKAWFEVSDPATVPIGDLAAIARWSPVEEVDWEQRWRDSFAPVVVSPRITIAPPWDAPPGALIIEPGQGFGTGEHPTTRQALQLLDAWWTDGTTGDALDLGCGSGILALAAARLGARVWGVDVEPEAIRDAVANAAANGLAARFDTTPIGAIPAPADLVLANLHAELLVEFAAPILRLTGKCAIFAGILADREQKVLDAYPQLRVTRRLVDGEWVALQLEPR